MTIVAYMILVGFLPASWAAFSLLEFRRAIIAVVVAGYLFLPCVVIPVPGLPDYSREVAISLSLVVGVMFFGRSAPVSGSFGWLDLPILGCLCAGSITAISSGVGIREAVAELLDRVFYWLIPYVVGRRYFGSAADARLLLSAVVLGALCYAPLCLYEVRMSPQLHRIVYGGHAFQDFTQAMRGGGYRPTVFLPHGLKVALWMACGLVASIGLRRGFGVHRMFGVPVRMWTWSLCVTLLLCKSTGASILGIMGAMLVALPVHAVLISAIAWVIPLYVWVRMAGHAVLVEPIGNLVASLVSTRAAESMLGRIEMESLLLLRFWQAPLFGVSAWAINHPILLAGGEIVEKVIPDSQWIVIAVAYGAFGLLAGGLVYWLPVICAVRRWRRDAATNALAVIVLLVLVDALLNTPFSVLYLLFAGALMSTASGAYAPPIDVRVKSRDTCRFGVMLVPRRRAVSVR